MLYTGIAIAAVATVIGAIWVAIVAVKMLVQVIRNMFTPGHPDYWIRPPGDR